MIFLFYFFYFNFCKQKMSCPNCITTYSVVLNAWGNFLKPPLEDIKQPLLLGAAKQNRLSVAHNYLFVTSNSILLFEKDSRWELFETAA